MSVDEIKLRNRELLKRKNDLADAGIQPGLYLAKMGSVYDAEPSQPSQTGQRTRPSTSQQTRSTFEKTESSIKRQPFDTFYTINMSKDPPQQVQFTTQNRFEGRSSYFNYYPTESVVEQRLETVWFEQ